MTRNHGTEQCRNTRKENTQNSWIVEAETGEVEEDSQISSTPY